MKYEIHSIQPKNNIHSILQVSTTRSIRSKTVGCGDTQFSTCTSSSNRPPLKQREKEKLNDADQLNIYTIFNGYIFSVR